MPYFKVRCTKDDQGNYDLSYGKGSKKLTAKLFKQDDGKWSFTNSATAYDKKRDALKQWEESASAEYGVPQKQQATACASETSQPADASSSSDEALTWAVAFARVAKTSDLTPSQRHDLKLLLMRLLGEDAPKAAVVTPPSRPPAIVKRPPPPPPPVFKTRKEISDDNASGRLGNGDEGSDYQSFGGGPQTDPYTAATGGENEAVAANDTPQENNAEPEVSTGQEVDSANDGELHTGEVDAA